MYLLAIFFERPQQIQVVTALSLRMGGDSSAVQDQLRLLWGGGVKMALDVFDDYHIDKTHRNI